jgi:catechol 2,3-dioxygenase-like lactoylglutathione lyase family enzyme
VEPGRRLIGSVPGMEVEIAFTGLPVTSLATGRDFFERLFGRPADVEVAVDEVMWRLAESAWLYVVVDAARAGQGLVALSVADLPATLAELAQRDIHPDRMEDVGGGRKATVLDPDGNTVAIISVPVERAAGARPRATG